MMSSLILSTNKPSCWALLVVLLVSLLASSSHAQPYNATIALPELGDSSSGTVSLAQEYQLGRVWLMSLRSRVPIVTDPLLQSYLEHLTYKLASHSELKDRRLDVVIIDNPHMNAFAVPGGVIGVNNGLFLYADNEAQLASILSHELAHVSQRHYARGLEAQRRSTLPTMAGLLAGVVLAATVGGDAGMAAIASTQAASAQNRLNFSRQNEQEADRIGTQTLVRAGMDPYATADMFENMQQASRYSGNRVPEFLRTHPVTASRISDARDRARLYPPQTYTNDDLMYQLMRARVELHFAKNSWEAVQLFQSKLSASDDEVDSAAAQYGLVLALTDSGDYQAANKYLQPLRRAQPHQVAYIVAEAQLNIATKNYRAAVNLLNEALSLSPGNHPLTMTLARALILAGEPAQAEVILEAHAKLYPRDPAVWFLLAETYGLAGNIVGVHRARAEYFLLNGQLDSAEKQLGYALPLVKGNKVTTAKIQARIKQIQQVRTVISQM